MGDFRKKNFLKSDFEHKKKLARKYLPYNSFVCQGKIFYHQRFGGKKFLRKPIKSPIPRSKSNGRPLITCRKSCYRLILRLRHQSLIVHSRSKLVHDCTTSASRLVGQVLCKSNFKLSTNCTIVVTRQVNIMIKQNTYYDKTKYL